MLRRGFTEAEMLEREQRDFDCCENGEHDAEQALANAALCKEGER